MMGGREHGSHIQHSAGEAGVKAGQGVSVLSVFPTDCSNLGSPLCCCSHNQRGSTFRHPLTGQMSAESSDFILQEQ